MYRFHSASVTGSRGVDAARIWDVRVKHLEAHVLCRPPWREGFCIWNAGREGKHLYRSLTPAHQLQVLLQVLVPAGHVITCTGREVSIWWPPCTVCSPGGGVLRRGPAQSAPRILPPHGHAEAGASDSLAARGGPHTDLREARVWGGGCGGQCEEPGAEGGG